MRSVDESIDFVSLNSPVKVKAYTRSYRTSGRIILETDQQPVHCSVITLRVFVPASPISAKNIPTFFNFCYSFSIWQRIIQQAK